MDITRKLYQSDFGDSFRAKPTFAAPYSALTRNIFELNLPRRSCGGSRKCWSICSVSVSLNMRDRGVRHAE